MAHRKQVYRAFLTKSLLSSLQIHRIQCHPATYLCARKTPQRVRLHNHTKHRRTRRIRARRQIHCPPSIRRLPILPPAPQHPRFQINIRQPGIRALLGREERLPIRTRENIVVPYEPVLGPREEVREAAGGGERVCCVWVRERDYGLDCVGFGGECGGQGV